MAGRGYTCSRCGFEFTVTHPGTLPSICPDCKQLDKQTRLEGRYARGNDELIYAMARSCAVMRVQMTLALRCLKTGRQREARWWMESAMAEEVASTWLTQNRFGMPLPS